MAFLLTFENTTTVLKAERHLKSKGYMVQPQSTPNALNHECGICLFVQEENEIELKSQLNHIELEPIRIFSTSEDFLNS